MSRLDEQAISWMCLTVPVECCQLASIKSGECLEHHLTVSV